MRPRTVKASDLPALEAESHAVLKECADEIVEGRIDGRPWFAVVMGRAETRLRRRRAWRARREN